MSRFGIVVLVLLVCLPGIASAATGTPMDPKSRYIVGDGDGKIEFEGKPTKAGLIFKVQEPERCLEDKWIILAYNASDKPMRDIRVRLEWKVDGKWYLSSLDGEPLISPNELAPGEWGWADAGTMGCIDDWDAFRVKKIKDDRENHGKIVDLNMLNVQKTDESVRATIANRTEFDVKDIQVEFLCMDRTGWFTDAYISFVNLRKLDAQDWTVEDLTTGNGSCDTPYSFMTALAVRRE
jgi:hypothetical protein